MKKITRLNALLTALGFPPDPNENVSLLKIAAGEYLKAKKALSAEEIKLLSPSPAVKRLELGDTKTEFDTDNFTTPEQRFDLLTEYLITSGKTQLEGYRRLKW